MVEPWLLCFEADLELRPVMTPEDLKRAGLDELGKKWGLDRRLYRTPDRALQPGNR